MFTETRMVGERPCAVQTFLFTAGLLVDLTFDGPAFYGYSARYCYETADQALEEMLGESDFRARAWIDAPDPAPERINGPGRVTLRHRRKGGEYLADVEMQNDGWVVVSDTAWKGWRAYIDGRRVETTRANIAFLSVFVPKGKHTIRLAYWPESFVVGRAISAATVLALIAFALISVRWARNA